MLYSESIENKVQLFDIPGIPEYKITYTGQVYSLFSKKFISPRNTSGRGYYNYILYTNGKRNFFLGTGCYALRLNQFLIAKTCK